MSVNRDVYYAGIDALRFIAALLIVVFHYFFWSWAGNGTTARAFNGAARFPIAEVWTWFGWVGVQIFFVISGFVIANSARGKSAAAYLKGRILRLYPAAWICATATMLFVVLILGNSFTNLRYEYLATLTLWPIGFWIDGVYWTLAVEIAFYGVIFFLLLARCFERIGLIAWLLTIWSGSFIVFELACRAGYVTDAPSILNWMNAQWRWVNVSLARHGAFFALGIWLWLASTQRLSRLARAGLILSLLVSALEIIAKSIASLSYSPHAPTWWIFSPLCIWLGAVVLIYFNSKNPALLGGQKVPMSRYFRIIGLMTYPLYLVHNVVGAGTAAALIRSGIEPTHAIGITIAIMLAISWIVATMLEPIVRRLLGCLLDLTAKMLEARRVLVGAKQPPS